MKESMVIYESAYKAINYLPDEKLQLEAYKGLMEYGFYGVIPESENPFVNMVFVQAIPCMRSAAERYELAVENGKKGGRPTNVPTEEIIRMKKDGMTNKQIAEKIGCSVSNIENRVSTYNKTHPNNPNNHPNNHPNNPTSEDGEVYPNNPNNLSDTVSYTVTDTVSYTDTDTVSDSYTSTGTVSSEYANATNINLPEEKREDESSSGNYRGRRIRDLSETEAKEIKKKLNEGVRYLDIEKEYGMRRGVITQKFPLVWQQCLVAKVNGRI